MIKCLGHLRENVSRTPVTGLVFGVPREFISSRKYGENEKCGFRLSLEILIPHLHHCRNSHILTPLDSGMSTDEETERVAPKWMCMWYQVYREKTCHTISPFLPRIYPLKIHQSFLEKRHMRYTSRPSSIAFSPEKSSPGYLSGLPVCTGGMI